MSFFIQTIMDALSLGSLYALSALGIALLFSIMRLVNFAHADFISFGVYALLLSANLAIPLAVLITIVAVVILSLLSERLAFRPVRSADTATLLVTSFSLSYFLQNAIILAFGARGIGFDILPELSQPFIIGDIRIPRLDVVTIVTALVLLGLLASFLRFTPLGVQMRAAAVDFRMARLLGVRANRVIAVAFAASGVMAAAVSVLYAAQTGTASPTMGLRLALIGFVATVVGGMGSLAGAVFGGFAVGILSVCIDAILPPELRVYREAFVYSVVIAVLIIRPDGLFRNSSVRERV